MKTVDGEFIDLVYESYPHDVFIRGHIDDLAAKKIIEDQDFPSSRFCPPRRIYAAWRMGFDDGGDWQHQLWKYEHSGRGKFAVTVFEPLSDLQFMMDLAFVPNRILNPWKRYSRWE